MSKPVVVFEQPVPAGQQADVAVSVTAHGHPALLVVSNLEILGHFQQQALPALNESVQARGLRSLQFIKGKITEILNKRVFAQSAVVNVSVVVPGVPVVGVVSR